ncbi:MAG: tRNA (N6-threonylcarbamoyladenosine(37)-N6)-methyltransferase TrmO [Anaerovibrio sp.]|uniref:tRNA (N6-threonylcarbamoyladenosine(37)-N6)-methyltransferase TrmO n=1 Tax=Anaerovibrio TaxID=82373 RepID=UPI001B18C064|nr:MULTISPECIES: tRNA (N6-threonylcarbamoyladenosine(37)-N6)-methyltransferase TrmO [Anaerovibrio]MBO5588497.1 tRNA (N6-threonylcarbamoyladenosine(37)-N6)-methyltransferase TrmO [Anaerovibrio sp.]MBO6246223.1 tRNA (N6-threonylcarbamoyladenosine(37)-N6)-methyltransferase TrmO [Anaerovibrio sp.]
MADIIETKIIGRIHTDFPTKFGIPRQSGVVKELKGRIVFEPEYRNEDALRGIEGFSHLWLIWQFSENVREGWSPTVRPPILGGNTRVGVFATRSPFRPNPIGLSSVKLEGVEVDPHDGTVLVVSGADLMDGTPILDIKPYIPYADSHPEATEGFRSGGWNRMLEVDFPPELLAKVPEKQHKSLIEVLANDPRPSYHHDPARIYGMPFGDVEVKFSVNEKVLRVVAVYD